MLPNTDDSPSKDLWVAHGWPPWLLEPEQLYDLVLDPNETRNLIGDSGRAHVASDLRARLEEWMRDTGDPLLDGPVLPPAGGEINDPDQRSAADPTVLVAAP